MSVTLEVDLPADLARLQNLLDRQDAGNPLTETERGEAEGLVDLADLLSLLRLRTERMTPWAIFRRHSETR